MAALEAPPSKPTAPQSKHPAPQSKHPAPQSKPSAPLLFAALLFTLSFCDSSSAPGPEKPEITGFTQSGPQSAVIFYKGEIAPKAFRVTGPQTDYKIQRFSSQSQTEPSGAALAVDVLPYFVPGDSVTVTAENAGGKAAFIAKDYIITF